MELIGVVIFKLSNAGSHSENVNPYLYTGNGKFVKIFKSGDNPFENNTLKQYDSHKVKVLGEYNEYNVFVIDSIDDFVLTEDKAEETPAEETDVKEEPVADKEYGEETDEQKEE